MKTRICLLLCLLAWMDMQAQENIDISGPWTLFEMIWSNNQDTSITTEDQLSGQGQMADYFFNPDGTFKLVSNMTGSDKMETMEGTWKLEGDKLIISLKMGDNPVDITWDFVYSDGVINLSRTSPDGSTSVVNSFKRKASD